VNLTGNSRQPVVTAFFRSQNKDKKDKVKLNFKNFLEIKVFLYFKIIYKRGTRM
tara:strand:+ start:1010 stop:1171 length:162 start_codon:yes stop_codon:yes gene_type:complete